MNFWDYFTDPVVRAPTLGTLFMCIASSLMGVLILLKKRSLMTESLSHTTYPGIVLFVSLFAWFLPQHEEWVFLPIFLGAFASSLLALKTIEWLEKRMRSDAALCFVLACFFGLGIVGASAMQNALPKWHQAVQMLLFGQAATMNDLHIALYASLALLVSLFLTLSFRPLQAVLFDRSYAASIGIRVPFFERILFWLLLFSLVVGIRSVGVILMSGMVIAPAIAARQFSDRLQTVFYLAALFGAISGLLGNILSVEISLHLSRGGERLVLPTGPVIVLVGTSLALFSLAFAPKRGLLFRWFRIAKFRLQRLEENILKGIWKKGIFSRTELREAHRVPYLFVSYALLRLKVQGWVEERSGQIRVSPDGRTKAAAIVRLHRLWELYLAEELGLEIGKVHQGAEEMEHVLTPDLEKRLTRILLNPKQDPHHQPIPEIEGAL